MSYIEIIKFKEDKNTLLDNNYNVNNFDYFTCTLNYYSNWIRQTYSGQHICL